MIPDSGRYDDVLVSLRRRFLIGAVILFSVAMLCAYQERSKRLLEKTQTDLLSAQAGLSKVKSAIINYRKTLTQLKAQFEKEGDTTSSARIVYGRMDEIIATYKPDEVTVGALEKKNNDVTLSFTLKFVDSDYNRFLSIASELQRGTYPISQVSSLSLSQTALAGKGGLTSSISGRIVSIEKSKP